MGLPLWERTISPCPQAHFFGLDVFINNIRKVWIKWKNFKKKKKRITKYINGKEMHSPWPELQDHHVTVRSPGWWTPCHFFRRKASLAHRPWLWEHAGLPTTQGPSLHYVGSPWSGSSLTVFLMPHCPPSLTLGQAPLIGPASSGSLLLLICSSHSPPAEPLSLALQSL